MANLVSPWIFWFVLAILCITMEIFIPTFVFLSLGLGAIIAGLISLIFPDIPFQMLVFAITTFLLVIWVQKMGLKLFTCTLQKPNIYSLKDKKGIITKEVTTSKRGYVRIGNDEWPAVSKEEANFASGQVVKVIDIAGTKLVVGEESEER